MSETLAETLNLNIGEYDDVWDTVTDLTQQVLDNTKEEDRLDRALNLAMRGMQIGALQDIARGLALIAQKEN